MRTRLPTRLPIAGLRLALPLVCLGVMLLEFTFTASAFDGEIDAAIFRGMQRDALRYTVGPDHMRIEVTGTNWPNPVDILERKSGALTLVFPHNRSFVRLRVAAQNTTAGMPGMPGIPMPPGGLPPGIGPRADATPGAPRMAVPAGAAGAPAWPTGRPAMPAMPNMPMSPMMGQKLEVTATGQTTNILGLACQQYELKQRGETMEIWATDQLPPYAPYLSNQPHRTGARQLQEQWPGLMAERKLFPMIVSRRFGSGPERLLTFEVTSVRTNKVVEPDEKLFEPPPGYREVRPLPF
jgi:hypothetical protein